MKIEKTYLPFLLFYCIAIGVLIGGNLNQPISKSLGKKYYKTKLIKLL